MLHSEISSLRLYALLLNHYSPVGQRNVTNRSERTNEKRLNEKKFEITMGFYMKIIIHENSARVLIERYFLENFLRQQF